jgi:hypothetical protein
MASRVAAPLCAMLLGSTAMARQVHAQVTEVSRTPVADASRLTFGYLCDDRFVVRNDGSRPLDLEYSVEKSNEHSKLRLNERESVELASPSKEALELWMDGKLIAKAIKDKRSCKEVQGNASVMVAPLEVVTNTPPARTAYPYGYGAPYPYYDPWAYGFYGSLAFRPYYSGYIGVPIVVGGPRGGGRRR